MNSKLFKKFFQIKNAQTLILIPDHEDEPTEPEPSPSPPAPKRNFKKVRTPQPWDQSANQEDLFNFLGVLSFKVKKKGLSVKRQAFERVAEAARDDLFCDILALISDKVESQSAVAHISQLSLEVNRRDFLKRRFIFKMVQWLDFKKRFAMVQLRLRARGINFALSPESLGQAIGILRKIFILVNSIWLEIIKDFGIVFNLDLED